MQTGYFFLVVLVVGVIFVNGWTDAPNSITSIVCTGVLPFRRAALLAAGCNLCGLLLSWLLAPKVTNTIREMADFSQTDPFSALSALCAAMAAVILFAVAAWIFGIPTSESHALLAALSGAAAALGGKAAISEGAWGKVLWGLLLSSAGGLVLGFLVCGPCARLLKRGGHRGARRIQLFCSVLLSLMHGAQDGLKFVGVLLVADSFLLGAPASSEVDLSGSLGAVLLCGVVMSVGTLVGGRRIIEAVGEQMVSLGERSGSASDLAAALLLLGATATGIPMSTTHTKTCAVMGAGLRCGETVHLRVVGRMALAWGITFPVCGLIGWLITRLVVGA
ncbi:MAG: inorganic phosphate transporter [Clostridiales bacterium]|uniref:inorganic phosphate transporter n=1 Tax=Provencibacterium massiliense TaxID=1841868 RepID=UPI0009A766E2|nr:inorganic phosphate transporter [Provencibacterium massiliense]PWM36574.1 MAG: inorganic phosphate transporter [Clostridiales bacterium]RGB68701.1 inorganic phosphate transporter [Harryflintia acetispora]